MATKILSNVAQLMSPKDRVAEIYRRNGFLPMATGSLAANCEKRVPALVV